MELTNWCVCVCGLLLCTVQSSENRALTLPHWNVVCVGVFAPYVFVLCVSQYTCITFLLVFAHQLLKFWTLMYAATPILSVTPNFFLLTSRLISMHALIHVLVAVSCSDDNDDWEFYFFFFAGGSEWEHDNSWTPFIVPGSFWSKSTIWHKHSLQTFPKPWSVPCFCVSVVLPVVWVCGCWFYLFFFCSLMSGCSCLALFRACVHWVFIPG